MGDTKELDDALDAAFGGPLVPAAAPPPTDELALRFDRALAADAGMPTAPFQKPPEALGDALLERAGLRAPPPPPPAKPEPKPDDVLPSGQTRAEYEADRDARIKKANLDRAKDDSLRKEIAHLAGQIRERADEETKRAADEREAKASAKFAEKLKKKFFRSLMKGTKKK